MMKNEISELVALMESLNSKVRQIERMYGNTGGPSANSTILTRHDVCSYLKISKATFHRYVNNLGLKTVKIGRKVFVRRKDLDDFISTTW